MEIKFRTFDGVIIHSWEELCDERMPITILKSRSISIQYSTLKDKYNTEIYEGDVVKANNGVYFIITQQEGNFNCSINNKIIMLLSVATRNKDIEVIGNIYEDKELHEKIR